MKNKKYGDTSTTYERRIRRHNLKPLSRQSIGDGIYLYMAEGLKDPNEAMDELHWLMIWAVGLDDNLKIGQYVRVPAYVVMPQIPGDIITPDSFRTVKTTPETRFDVARRQALRIADIPSKKGIVYA